MSLRSISAMHRFCAIATTVFLLTACANQATPLALSGAVTQAAPAAQANQPLPVTVTSTPEPTPTSTPTTEPTSTFTPTPTPTETATPSPTAEVTPGAVVRGDQNVNLRKGPGSHYDGLGQIAPGALMEVVATAEMNGQTWYQVKLADGRLGWVRKDLVEANEKAGAVPKASDVPPTPTLRPKPTATPRPAATKPPEVRGNESGIPADVMQLILNDYGSLDAMVGQTMEFNGATAVQNGENPTYHGSILWVRLTEDLGMKTAPDGSRLSHRFMANAGPYGVIRVSLMDDPLSPDWSGLHSNILSGIWGYGSWGYFLDGQGNPVKTLLGISQLQQGASLSKVAGKGDVIGIFVEDQNDNSGTGNSLERGGASCSRVLVLNR